MNQENIDKFFGVYAEKLHQAVIENPGAYSWPVENVPLVVERMKAAALRRAFGWDSPAFKKTCRAIGIKHGMNSIFDYLGI